MNGCSYINSNLAISQNEEQCFKINSIQPGRLARLYSTNGGNATIVHLQQASQWLYQLRIPGDLAQLWRYVMFREQFQPLGRRKFSLYIKKDIAPLWHKYADLVEYPVSGEAGKVREV